MTHFKSKLLSKIILSAALMMAGAWVFILPSAASAATYYVRTDGNNACTGLQNVSYAQDAANCAWKTIAYALSNSNGKLVPGTTVRIQAGTYQNETALIGASGTAADPIKIIGDGNPLMIDTARKSALGINTNGQSYLEISGITIKDYIDAPGGSSGTGIQLKNSTYVTLSDMTLVANRWNGISFSGSNYNTVRNSRGNNNGNDLLKLGGNNNIVDGLYATVDSSYAEPYQMDYVISLSGNSTYNTIKNVTAIGVQGARSFNHVVCIGMINSTDFVSYESSPRYNTVENVYALDSNGPVIQLRNGAHHNTVTNAVIINESNSNGAIQMENNVNDNTITNFVIINPKWNGIYYGGGRDNGGANRNVFKNGIIVLKEANSFGINFATGLDSVFENITIYGSKQSDKGISGTPTATIKNCIFSNLSTAVSASGSAISYSAFYNNGSDIASGANGTGNIFNTAPLFINPTTDLSYDFHLKSQYGRWNGTAWVTDSVTSPAIDAGDPTSDYSNEPAPNGGRINMGAYGNTTQASLSGVSTTVSTPTFSPAAGTYTSTQTVTISTATAGATIYYTSDGSTPTTSSTVYSSPITVSSTATIKALALAVKSGLTDSSVASATYTIATPVLTSITVAPSTASIGTGATQSFTATPKDQFGNTMTGITISWTSSNTSVATINSSGLATGVSQGTSTITASSGGVSGTASLTVTAPPILTSITVSPSTASVTIGSTQTFTATPKDQFGSTMSGIIITWSSSNTSVATINSSSMATGVAVSSSTITASSGGVSGTATLTVTNQPSGLAAYWKFDENTGTAALDSSGNGNTGTISGAAWTQGKVNSALQFDGVNDSVAISGVFDPANVGTVTMWLNASAAGGARIFGFHDAYEIRLTSSGSGYIVSNQLFAAGSSVLDGTIVLPFNEWHFIALTYNFSTTLSELYIDGVFNANAFVANDDPLTGTLSIGARTGATPLHTGSIDEVKIFSRALSASEILADYNAGIPSSDTTLPVISISSPTNNTTVSNPSITVSGTASDNIALSKVEIKLNSGSYQTTTSTTSWSIPLTLVSGSNTITARATDTSNNTKETSITVSYTPPDTTSPTISNISTSNITSTSATINFTTNENTTSYIEYGLTSGYGSQTTPNQTPISQYPNILISNLSSNTTYHYKIISQDIAGNITNSTNKTFATLASTAPDTTPPSAIANLASSNITQTSVNLSWTSTGDDNNTGTASGYDIRYSTQNITEANWNQATQVTGEPNPQIAGTAQSKYISVSLTPNATYYFAIKSQDEVPNVSSLSNILQITTLATTVTPPPVSGGGGGGGSYSDTTPPAKPADFKLAPADKQITLSWKNPTDSDFVRVLIIRKENSAPTSQTDGTAIYEGTNQTYTDINLDNGKTYHYAIFAYDAKPNYSQILSLSAKPQAGVDSTSTINTPTPAYPDSTLIKTSSSPKVYVVINGKKKWISTPEVFETLGYKWTAITIADDAAIKSISDYEDNLIRAIGDYKVYLVVNGISRHIPNPEIFLDYGFAWDDVKDVPQATINKYSRGYLIRESRQGDIFYLSPNGVKKWIPNPEIFSSYNNRWEDIQVVSKKEMDSCPESNLRRYNNQIFLIENNAKRLIPNETVLNRYDVSLILDVNKDEFDWWKTGSMVK